MYRKTLVLAVLAVVGMIALPGVAEQPERQDGAPAETIHIDVTASEEIVHQVADLNTPNPAPVVEEPARNAEVPMGPPAPILDGPSSRVSFQARLTNLAGDPLVGPVNLTFNIYTTGGALIEGPINVNNVPLNDGVASVQVPVTDSTFNGDGREIGVSVNGEAELSPRVPMTAVPYAFRVDRVASAELDDSINLGETGSTGNLHVFGSIAGDETIHLDGNNSQIHIMNDVNIEVATLGYFDYGTLRLRDIVGNQTMFLNGSSGDANAVGGFHVFDNIGGQALATLDKAALGGRVQLYTNGGDLAGVLGINALLGGGFSQYMQPDGDIGVSILGQGIVGGEIFVGSSTGATTIDMRGSFSGANPAAWMALKDGNAERITFAARNGDTNAGGLIDVKNDDSFPTLRLAGDGPGSRTGEIRINDGVSETVRLFGSTSFGSCFEMFENDGTNTLQIFASQNGTNGARVFVRDGSGNTNITLNGDTGTTTTQVLTITGGADLSEQFDVNHRDGEIEPGMVVSIDPASAGKLVVSNGAYDRKVAGIVSGAGGVSTGMMMGQAGTLANGAHAVALTGRVYCWVDASNGAVQPGDLLTTSNTPGHAMKVSDHTSAQGAIIGKAMTSLNEGKGLVLVLVSLQ